MSYRITTTASLVIAESTDERLIFPFRWDGFERAYTYASISGARPQIERGARKETMDLATFTRWMALLESLSSSDDATMEIAL
jgi:hypothetical protein